MFAILTRTLHDRFVLSVHEVNHDGLISLEVGFPALLGNHVVRSTVIIFGLGVRFINDSI